MQKSDDDEKVELIVPISCLGKALRPRPGMSRQLHGASYNTEICALFKSYLLIRLWDYATGVVLTSEWMQTKGTNSPPLLFLPQMIPARDSVHRLRSLRIFWTNTGMPSNAPAPVRERWQTTKVQVTILIKNGIGTFISLP